MGLILALRCLKPDKTYELTFIGDDRVPRTEVVSGKQLKSKGLPLAIEDQPGSLLVKYRVVK